MPKSKANQEIEIKLRVTDAFALRKRLKKLRARVSIPRTYESNSLYDTKTRHLTRNGRLIRIRIEQQPGNRRKACPTAILTYKGPVRAVQPSKSAPRNRDTVPQFKMREEIELLVADAEQMSAVLEALDLHPMFRYEKYRTTYVMPGIKGLKVEFDETPIGLFLELEGTVAAINGAARLLGYERSEYVTDSYGALFIADCEKLGKKPTHMLFQPTKILR